MELSLIDGRRLKEDDIEEERERERERGVEVLLETNRHWNSGN